MTDEAFQQCGDRGPLSSRVYNQNNGPAGNAGEFSGRAGLAFGAGPVEQSHNTFAQDDIGAGLELGNERRKGGFPHRPDIEIHTGFIRRHRVESGIDEIGSCLSGCDA
jgi:hypothetical protein